MLKVASLLTLTVSLAACAPMKFGHKATAPDETQETVNQTTQDSKIASDSLIQEARDNSNISCSSTTQDAHGNTTSILIFFYKDSGQLKSRLQFVRADETSGDATSDTYDFDSLNSGLLLEDNRATFYGGGSAVYELDILEDGSRQAPYLGRIFFIDTDLRVHIAMANCEISPN